MNFFLDKAFNMPKNKNLPSKSFIKDQILGKLANCEISFTLLLSGYY